MWGGVGSRRSVGSEIVAGVRQVEALVGEREVGHDRVRQRDRYRGPVEPGWVHDLGSRQASARVDLHAMDDGAAPPLNDSDPTSHGSWVGISAWGNLGPLGCRSSEGKLVGSADEMGREAGGRRVLLEADGEAGEDISMDARDGADGQLDGGVIQSCVGGKATGASDVAQASQVPGLVAGQDRGAGEAIPDDRVA